jgi:hypothetical protein
MGEHADDAGYRIVGTFEHETALSYFEKAKLNVHNPYLLKLRVSYLYTVVLATLLSLCLLFS